MQPPVLTTHQTQYDYANPGVVSTKPIGHFTQVVWNSTTSVGCAVRQCPGGMSGVTPRLTPAYYVVCRYFSPGNWAGEYAANVLPPKAARRRT